MPFFFFLGIIDILDSGAQNNDLYLYSLCSKSSLPCQPIKIYSMQYSVPLYGHHAAHYIPYLFYD